MDGSVVNRGIILMDSAATEGVYSCFGHADKVVSRHPDVLEDLVLHHGKIDFGKVVFHDEHVGGQVKFHGLFRAMGVVLGGISADGNLDRPENGWGEDWMVGILLGKVFIHPFGDGSPAFIGINGRIRRGTGAHAEEDYRVFGLLDEVVAGESEPKGGPLVDAVEIGVGKHLFHLGDTGVTFEVTKDKGPGHIVVSHGRTGG